MSTHMWACEPNKKKLRLVTERPFTRVVAQLCSPADGWPDSGGSSGSEKRFPSTNIMTFCVQCMRRRMYIIMFTPAALALSHSAMRRQNGRACVLVFSLRALKNPGQPNYKSACLTFGQTYTFRSCARARAADNIQHSVG